MQSEAWRRRRWGVALGGAAALWAWGVARAEASDVGVAQRHGQSQEVEGERTNDLAPLPDPRRRSRFVLLGVDCFGLGPGERCAELQEAAGLELGQAMTPGWSGRGAARQLQLARGYAFVGLSPVFTLDGAAWLTIDVVRPDARERLVLNPSPSGSVRLRSNLLELYGSFANLQLEVAHAGGEVGMRPGADGTWQVEEPRLAPFTALFRAEAPSHREELIQVLTADREPSRRRAAAGLLGYDSASAASADALGVALLDPDLYVRAEAARALVPRLHTAQRATDAPVDVEVVCRLLELPSAADRSAAASLLAELARLPELRPRILERAMPVLLQMLESPRESVAALAEEVLRRVTGLELGRDASLWRAELRRR